MAPLADLTRPLEEVTRQYILAVLRLHGGNRARAAEALGIGVATLYRRLRQYEGAAKAR